jgi:hypothetical protein
MMHLASAWWAQRGNVSELVESAQARNTVAATEERGSSRMKSVEK